jgi:hypothetical protein
MSESQEDTFKGVHVSCPKICTSLVIAIREIYLRLHYFEKRTVYCVKHYPIRNTEWAAWERALRYLSSHPAHRACPHLPSSFHGCAVYKTHCASPACAIKYSSCKSACMRVSLKNTFPWLGYQVISDYYQCVSTPMTLLSLEFIQDAYVFWWTEHTGPRILCDTAGEPRSRVRAVTVDNFRRNSFACPWEFWAAISGLGVFQCH